MRKSKLRKQARRKRHLEVVKINQKKKAERKAKRAANLKTAPSN